MKRVLVALVAVLLMSVPCLFAQVIETWDFEAGQGDWTNTGGGAADISVSADQALSGTQSLKLVGKADHDQINFRNDVYEDLQEGDVLTFNIWISAADLALVNGCQIFWQDGAGWSWHSQWVNASDLTADAWAAVQVTLPAIALPLQTFGLQVMDKDAASTPTIYVDDITVTGPAAFMITVDAEKDAFYSALTGPDDGYLQLKSYAFNDNGIPKSDTDLSAKMWFAWDDEWLYFYEEVMDDTISMTSANTYQNDGFELKVDPQPTDSTKNSTFGLEFTALYDTTATGAAKAGHTNINLADSLKQFARKLIPGGYALELAVKWSAITAGTPVEAIVPAVDNVFGAAVQNHDNDNATGKRDATVQWAAVLKDASWNTPKYDGTVKFLADNKLQFIPSNNMTGEANPVPYDGTPFYMRIDAQRDPFYRQLTGPDDGYLQLKSYAFNDNGIPTSDADLSAKMWFAWDAEWLYFYEEVKDDTISMSSANTYQNDGFELKIDPQATDSTKNSTISLDFTARYDTTATGTEKAGSKNTSLADSVKQYARKVITGGYALELAVKWSAITAGTPVETVAPAVGNVFGASMNNHDNDNTKGTREASIQWAANLTDKTWNTPKYNGTVTFLADNKLQFVAANNMTGKANPVPYDGTPFYLRIDGKKDPFFWSLAGPEDGYVQISSLHASIATGQVIGQADDDKDLSAKLWSAWDDTWFYLYGEITDDTVSVVNATNFWRNDGLEIKLDGHATDSTQTSVSFGTSITAIDTPAATGLANSLSEVTNAADRQYARATKTGGYIVEFAIKLSVLGGTEPIAAAIGEVFGMGVNIVDNDGKLATSNRQAAILWAAELNDKIWNTPKMHGTIELLADNKLNWDATNNMTGKGHGQAYDGSVTGVDEKDTPAAELTFALAQNYPNPFNPTTMISYSIPKASDVRLSVFDILGREVATLVNEKKSAGSYEVVFDGKNLSSGLYFYRIQAGEKVKTQKMMMLK